MTTKMFERGRMDRPGPTRREVLVYAAGALSAAATAHAKEISPKEASLGAVAAQAGLIFGSAASQELFDDKDYRDLFLAETRIFTPENALKFDALQPEQGQFNFAPADALVDFGRDNGLKVRGHNLFWNDYPPAWLKHLPAREIEAVFDRTIETVVPHFAGRLHSWDVVNEPFWLGRDRPGTFRPGPWYDAMGVNYIFRAFRRVASLDPDTRLVINEAWTERTDGIGLAVRHALLELIDRILDQGVKLDAVGLQGHLAPSEPYDDASFTEFLEQIAARHLDIYITEFDCNDRGFPDDVAQRDAKVAARTRAFLTAVCKVPAVKMIVTWGLSDRYSWQRDPAVMKYYGMTRLPRPLPFDDQLQKKPMATAMADVFRNRTTK
jgi:endo-1,4-beta-xylanase